MKIQVAAVALALAGCASSTGIVPIGDGLFMSSMQDYSLNYHGAKVKVDLYREAAQFCSQRGKKSIPVSDSSVDAALYRNYASAEIKFHCD